MRVAAAIDPTILACLKNVPESILKRKPQALPPELAERCIKAGCPDGGSVLDPFGGSGTTALVAASLGRPTTLIELNPDYAVMARARIEAAFMGKDEGARHMAKQLGRVQTSFEPGSLFASLDIGEAAE